MRLTLHSDYALRVLLFAAVSKQQLVSTRQIGDALGISVNHLAKVVNRLGREGFLEIRRGRNGGFRLARDPASIRVGDVLRATEPDFHLAECFDAGANSCLMTPVCGITPLFAEARDAFLHVLDRKSIADIIGGPASARRYRELFGLTDGAR